MVQRKPTLSIILTSCNRLPLLQMAIRSVMHQTYQNWELIISDNSTDEYTCSFLHELENCNRKIIVVQKSYGEDFRKMNKMVSVAVNTGLDIARGDYVTYLCDDDGYLPERCDTMMKSINDADAIVDRVVWVAIDGKRHPQNSFRYVYREPLEDGHADLLKQIEPSNYICHDSIIHRKSNLRWPTIDTHTPVDWRYWLSLAKTGFKFKCISSVGEEAMMPHAWRNGMTIEQATIARNLRPFYPPQFFPRPVPIISLPITRPIRIRTRVNPVKRKSDVVHPQQEIVRKPIKIPCDWQVPVKPQEQPVQVESKEVESSNPVQVESKEVESSNPVQVESKEVEPPRMVLHRKSSASRMEVSRTGKLKFKANIHSGDILFWEVDTNESGFEQKTGEKSMERIAYAKNVSRKVQIVDNGRESIHPGERVMASKVMSHNGCLFPGFAYDDGFMVHEMDREDGKAELTEGLIAASKPKTPKHPTRRTGKET